MLHMPGGGGGGGYYSLLAVIRQHYSNAVSHCYSLHYFTGSNHRMVTHIKVHAKGELREAAIVRVFRKQE